ncbi:MAG: hypothetical protein JHD38_21430 [Mycolicibacterium sp.]|nr:hypothetical protein [Mycolicibacterium sp.]
MKATILVPIAALLVAGAATAVGISLTSSADDAPASPIVVTAPQRVPTAPAPAASDLPAVPGPAGPASPRITAEPKAPPPVDVPAPPPAITHGGDDDGDDDDDGGWDD